MLSLRAVNQYYGNQHTLWNVDLDLPPGVCTGIVGLPGMGKTTLIHCIAGLLPVASGSMVWHEAGAPPSCRCFFVSSLYTSGGSMSSHSRARKTWLLRA